jgi:hypothetical protein
MAKGWLLVAMAASACTGCTMMSLERHTVSQMDSVVGLRYQEALNNLARVACDPWALPNFSSMFDGTITLTDMGSITSTTTWQHILAAPVQNGFSSEAFNPSVSRTIVQDWSLDPIEVPEKLEAMRSCCQWEIYGPDSVRPQDRGLLAKSDGNPSPGRHFGVQEKLERIPPGWLHVGRLRDVPACAAYKAHFRDTWVWVMPDGVKGLADFSLVLENIDRTSIESPTLLSLPPNPSVIALSTSDSRVNDPNKPADATNPATGIITYATVWVDACGRLSPATPYYQARNENVGSDAALRSQLSAASLTPPPP